MEIGRDRGVKNTKIKLDRTERDQRKATVLIFVFCQPAEVPPAFALRVILLAFSIAALGQNHACTIKYQSYAPSDQKTVTNATFSVYRNRVI